MTTAYSYLRFSSKKQGEGDSVRRQTAWAEETAAKNGWTLDTMLDAGRSAFKGANAAVGALAAFLKAVEAGDVATGSVLLVESLDRLSRQQIQKALSLFLGILASGVDIVTREPAMRYTSTSGMSDVMLALVHMERANSESEAKRMRTAEAWRNARASEGRTARGNVMGRRPWWKKGDEGRNAAVLHQIFASAAEGLGMEAIAIELNRERALDRIWSRTGVWMMLKDERLAPVVGRDTWAAVQTQLRVKRKCGRTVYGRVSNLFTKLLEAPDGTAMHLHTMKGHEPLLILNGSRDGRQPKDASFPYRLVEDFVLTCVDQLHQSDVLTSPDTRGLEAKLEAIDERIRAVASVGDVATLGTVLADLTVERKAVATALAEVQQGAVTASDWKALEGVLNSLECFQWQLNMTDRRALKARIARIIERIVIDTKELPGYARQAKITVVLRSGLRYEGVAKWVRRGRDRGTKTIAYRPAGTR